MPPQDLMDAWSGAVGFLAFLGKQQQWLMHFLRLEQAHWWLPQGKFGSGPAKAET